MPMQKVRHHAISTAPTPSSSRLGFTLAVLVLGAFLAVIGAVVLACVVVLEAARQAGPPASCSASSYWSRAAYG